MVISTVLRPSREERSNAMFTNGISRLGVALALVSLLVCLTPTGCGPKSDTVLGLTPPTTVVVDTTTGRIQSPAPSLDRLSSDPRKAIQLECFYALNQGYGGSSTKTLNGSYVGDWAYLLSDPNAYSKMKNHYGSNASVWYGWPSFYSNMDYYSFMAEKYGGGYFSTKYGRVMQCRAGANFILFRSGTYTDNNGFLESYTAYINDYNGPRLKTKPSTQTLVADVLQTKWANGGHTAIAVHIVTWDAQGRVVCIEVVDSNYVGGADNEIVGRHILRSIPAGQKGDGGVGDLDSYIALKLNYR